VIVLDASAAAKLVLVDEPYAGRALKLVQEQTDHGELTLAPPLLQSEVTNILRQRMRRTGMPLATATQLLADFLMLPISLTTPSGLYQRALELVEHFNLGATYDAQYVALAQIASCDLWTADERLVRDLSHDLPWVKWLGS
jgi:predicted nucleic acid-binding protein